MPPSKKSAAAAAAKKGEAETDDQWDSFLPFSYMPSVLQDEALVMLIRKF